MTTLLYLISPPHIDNLMAFAAQLEATLGAGGVGAFQLRLKADGVPKEGRLTLPSAPEDDVLRAAEVLLPICQAHGVAFILNDSPELAKACGADGVHLGVEDGAIAHAREILGEKAVIGATCHASRHLAMEAAEQGADYVAFGAFFPTRSKSDAAQEHWGRPSPEILQWWTTYTEIPCVAIGGITPENCAPLVRAGADFLAVITAVWTCPDGPAVAVQRFRDVMAATA